MTPNQNHGQAWPSDGIVSIRPYRLDDAAAHCSAADESAADLERWMEWRLPDWTERHSAAWIATLDGKWSRGEQYNFAVVEADGGRLIGGCSLNQFNTLNRSANLAYWIRTGDRGRGFAPKAIRLAAGFAFESLKLDRVEIVALPDNKASIRAALKAGAAWEAILRNKLRVKGHPMDAAVLSIIPADLM